MNVKIVALILVMSFQGLMGTLTGKVIPQEEGVLVSAKKEGSTITVTVVTDAEGRYKFPANRLGAGKYALRIRAAGYVLEGPQSVEVVDGKVTTADLKLGKATTNQIASELSNGEWLLSFPGTDVQKNSIFGCTHCHTLERIARSKYNEKGFEKVITRMMTYTPGSFPKMIQQEPRVERTGGVSLTAEQQQQILQRRSEYLSSVNLSKVPEWSYPLKTYPRPKGKDTKVIYTEYDLPSETNQPHDVIVDREGYAWYASFGEQILGKLDPKTGKVTHYYVPVTKPGSIKGTLDLEFDEDQNLWLGMALQGAVHQFDRKTETFKTFRLPPELDRDYSTVQFLAPGHSKVDGKVWVNDLGTYTTLRLDTATGKFESFEPFKEPRPNNYQVESDSQNNAWFTVFGRSSIGKIDAKTGAITFFEIPTPRSAPRRGHMDAQDRLWFVENSATANKVGMLDTKTGQFKEWSMPIERYWPYDCVIDKNDDLWIVSEFADRVLRLNTKTSTFTTYLLPQATNMRRAFVDNSTTPVTFWVGGTHTASIIKLEPLD